MFRKKSTSIFFCGFLPALSSILLLLSPMSRDAIILEKKEVRILTILDKETTEKLKFVFDQELKPKEKLVLMALSKNGLSEVSKSHKEISEETGFSIGTVKIALKELQEKNLVKIISGKSRGMRNTYLLNEADPQPHLISKDLFALLPKGIRLLDFRAPRQYGAFYTVHLEFIYRSNFELAQEVFQLANHFVRYFREKGHY